MRTDPFHPSAAKYEAAAAINFLPPLLHLLLLSSLRSPHVPHRRPLCGEADAAALHANLQAVRGLAAGVHDAAVHVAGAAAVVAQVVRAAAAAAAALGAAGAAGGLRRHHVAQRQELAGQAGQDAVDAAVWRPCQREEFQGENIF